MEDMLVTSLKRVPKNEGGFQKMYDDRGNWTSGKVGVGELKGTNCGISAMSYPDLDIEHLTFDQIAEIYRKDFWNPLKLDNYPKVLHYQLFDASILHGMQRTIKMLQRAVGVTDDGIIGRVTLNTIESTDPNDVVMLFIAERIDFIRKVSTFNIYGKGWMGRCAEALRYAAKDN